MRRLLALVLLAAPVACVAQQRATTTTRLATGDSEQEWLERCRDQDGHWEGRQRLARACELRELTLPAGALTVEAGRNGGIAVEAWDRDEVKVFALVAVHARSEEAAKGALPQVRVSTEGRTVRGAGPRDLEDGVVRSWSVSYRVRVPRRTDLTLDAHNGGIAIRGVTGRIYGETTNGGMKLEDVGGDVRVRTTNGGVDVRLAGKGWNGAGLDARTTNGGVTLRVPRDYAMDLETGTVNGSVSSDIPVTVSGRLDRRSLRTKLNGGGAPVRVTTTNGGVRIRED